MSPARPPRSVSPGDGKRPATRLAVIAALLGGFFVTGTATASTAQAHAELASANPAQGSILDGLPATVELTFTEAVGQPASIAVNGPEGATSLTSTAPEVVNRVLTQRLEAGAAAPAGEYSISYRVTSADGHPVSGTVLFTVGESATAAAATDVPTAGAGGAKVGVGVGAGVVAGLVGLLIVALALVVLGMARLVRREPNQ